MFKQPKGFTASFVTAMCDILSFYGVMSSIIVLLITVFQKNSEMSYQFFGMLMAVGYITPVLGGVLADRFYRRAPAVLIGLICIFLGSLCCIVMKFDWLMWGLSLMMIGIGLLKSNNITQVGMLYPAFSKQKERGITLVYLGMNCGAVLGPVAAAALGYFTKAYQAFFVFSAVLFLIPIILLSYRYQYLIALEKTELNIKKKALSTPVFLGIVLLFVILTERMFTNPILFNVIFGTGLVLTGVYICKILYQDIPEERCKMVFVLALCFCNIFFYLCYAQLSGALMLFSVLYSSGVLDLNIPMQWLTSIEPLSILLMSPLIIRWAQTKIGHEVNVNFTLQKFLYSLITAALAYYLFYLASDHLAHPGFFIALLVLGISLIGFGELVTTPTLYNAVSNLAEEKHRGFFMGLTWLVIAIASYFSSLTAAVMVGTKSGPSNLNEYHRFFISYAGVALVATFIFLVSMPYIKKLVVQRN